MFESKIDRPIWPKWPRALENESAARLFAENMKLTHQQFFAAWTIVSTWLAIIFTLTVSHLDDSWCSIVLRVFVLTVGSVLLLCYFWDEIIKVYRKQAYKIAKVTSDELQKKYNIAYEQYQEQVFEELKAYCRENNMDLKIMTPLSSYKYSFTDEEGLKHTYRFYL